MFNDECREPKPLKKNHFIETFKYDDGYARFIEYFKDSKKEVVNIELSYYYTEIEKNIVFIAKVLYKLVN